MSEDRTLAGYGADPRGWIPEDATRCSALWWADLLEAVQALSAREPALARDLATVAVGKLATSRALDEQQRELLMMVARGMTEGDRGG